MRIEPQPRSTATSPSRATSRSRTARCCSARSADGETRVARLRPLGRHRVDARRRARARRRRSTSDGGRRCASTASACAACSARRADRLRQRRHARAAARRAARRSRTGDVHAHRRRVALARGRWSASPSRCGRMGAERRDDRRPPAADDHGRRRCTPIDYELPVASAQVKSAILLAGLGADGRDDGRRAAPTRDHTELMLEAAGVRVTRRPSSRSRVDPAERLELGDVDVPGDFSSAAPFIVAATLVPGSRAHDPRRQPQPAPHRPARRARADGRPRRPSSTAAASAGEPAGDLEVRSAELDGDRRSRATEVPLLDRRAAALRAARRVRARRRAGVRGAEELRAKETDRIEAVVDALRATRRARRRRHDDGFSVRGVPARPRGGRIDARGDHRIAMLGAVAGLARARASRSRAPRASAVSFPGFFELYSIRSREPSTMIVAIDGPAGAGKSTVARRARGAARLPLPRHGGDVPRAHLARACAHGLPLGDASALGDARARAPGRVRRGRPRLHRRHRRHRRDPQAPRSTAWSPSSRATTRCAR